MGLESINICYSLEFDLDLAIINGSGSINVFDEETEEDTCIGHLSFNYYNVYKLSDYRDLLILADAISGDELYMVATLLQNDFDFEDGGKLITLDGIILEETHYSEELERQVLKEFLKYCQYMMFDYILVIASKPMKEMKNSKGVIEFPNLKLYTEFNFKSIEGSEGRAPVMLKNLNLIS